MQGYRGPGRHPQSMNPSNGSAPYSMTRVVPMRSPPPVKALPPPPARPKPLAPPPARSPAIHVPEAHNRQIMKNTYICIGVSFFTFFVVLFLVLGLSPREVLDGKIFWETYFSSFLTHFLVNFLQVLINTNTLSAQHKRDFWSTEQTPKNCQIKSSSLLNKHLAHNAV